MIYEPKRKPPAAYPHDTISVPDGAVLLHWDGEHGQEDADSFLEWWDSSGEELFQEWHKKMNDGYL